FQKTRAGIARRAAQVTPPPCPPPRRQVTEEPPRPAPRVAETPRTGVRKRPDDVHAWARLGDSKSHRHDYEGAIVAYRTALGFNPVPLQGAVLRASLGHCFLKLNALERAEQAYEEALHLRASKRWERQLAHIVAKRSGDNPADGHARRGHRLMQHGRYAEAINFFSLARRYDKANGRRWADLGIALYYAGHYTHATTNLDRAIDKFAQLARGNDRDAAEAQAFRYLGKSLLERIIPEEHIAQRVHPPTRPSFGAALRGLFSTPPPPPSPPREAKLRARRILDDNTAFAQRALKAFEAATARAPEDGKPWAGRAQALEALGRWEDATQSWQRAVRLAAGEARYWGHLGRSLTKQGLHEDAVRAFTEAVQRDEATQRASESPWRTERRAARRAATRPVAGPNVGRNGDASGLQDLNLAQVLRSRPPNLRTPGDTPAPSLTSIIIGVGSER
ncbi:MAG TPA: tetratricopeptide repeat protein, partial [Myxococcota bacterium]|nr:tetratricopeptide repeat protein [Myxococcota bacterium]